MSKKTYNNPYYSRTMQSALGLYQPLRMEDLDDDYDEWDECENSEDDTEQERVKPPEREKCSDKKSNESS